MHYKAEKVTSGWNFVRRRTRQHVGFFAENCISLYQIISGRRVTIA